MPGTGSALSKRGDLPCPPPHRLPRAHPQPARQITGPRGPATGSRLLAIAGIIGALALVTLVASAALAGYADEFARTGVPGTITVQAGYPATYSVYAEGTRWVRPTLRVTGPAGRAVPVQATAPGPAYYHGGNGGNAVGTFDATRPGT